MVLLQIGLSLDLHDPKLHPPVPIGPVNFLCYSAGPVKSICYVAAVGKVALFPGVGAGVVEQVAFRGIVYVYGQWPTGPGSPRTPKQNIEL